jgi:WD40 repeat protein
LLADDIFALWNRNWRSVRLGYREQKVYFAVPRQHDWALHSHHLVGERQVPCMRVRFLFFFLFFFSFLGSRLTNEFTGAFFHFSIRRGDSGMVSIYDVKSLHSIESLSSPDSFKTLKQMTTSIYTLKFNPDSQLLVMASRSKKDALRMVRSTRPSCSPVSSFFQAAHHLKDFFALQFFAVLLGWLVSLNLCRFSQVHVPSFKMFTNWPTERTPLHYVQDVDFSSNCRLMSIGNDTGKALLFQMNSYL